MIFFLYGPDTYRSRQKLHTIKNKFIKEVDPSGLNINTFYHENFHLEDFKQCLTTTPFLSRRRMVIVENLISGRVKKDAQKSLLELLKPGEEEKDDAIIIFWEGGLNDVHASSNILYNFLSLQKYGHKFELLQGQELKKWYIQKIQACKAQISTQTLDLLISYLGSDLWRASNEIMKLSSFCRTKPIESEDIKLLTQNTLEESIFDLTDAVGNKKTKTALDTLYRLYNADIRESEVLSKITWHVRNLLLVKNLATNNESSFTSFGVSKKIGIHPFAAKKALAQSRSYALDELKNIYQSLVDIDRMMKGSILKPRWLLDLFIIKTTRK